MDWIQIAGLIAAGFFAGFINTLAGSGSLITLPLLIFLGLPANVANGTNRIAILLQNVVAVSSFKQQKILDLKKDSWLAIPAIMGALVGSLLAVDINEEIMKNTIGGLLVFMFFIVLYKPDTWIKGKAGQVSELHRAWRFIIFFFIGVYGGFIQAGVGFFLLAGLVLGAGFDLVKANAVKVLIVLCFTVFALAVFIFNDQVNFLWGFILAIGSMSGAFVASRFAVSWGPKFVRYLLLVTLVAASLHLFGVFAYIFN
ncbi:MAG: sulfite exporter TauE/SafE family protein [Bacteroidales bacterium]|nr:sulfite exporter TauE/SafE family protein [Bacteroidales bacterium]MCF8456255.1 sulfite exporter TauE/SafE family protein [Bacteroidales bacterium]